MFKGFSEKTGNFLWELAFNNERPWFLQHKQEFEDVVNTPFKAMAQDTFGLIQQRFPDMDLRLHVSRIYRDARRLFGRGPYKDHMWFSVKASAMLLEGPMFWFEVGPADYSYGMGFYSASAQQMEAFRKAIEANPARFERIALKTEAAGFSLSGEEYKRPKASFDSVVIMRYYNRKRIGFEKSFDWNEAAYAASLSEEVAEAFSRLMPMYEFFMEVYRSAPAQPKKKR